MDAQDDLQEYLDGDLSKDAAAAFEQKMAGDPALAERVRLHQMLDGSLSNRKEIELEAKLKAVMEDRAVEQETGSDRKSSFRMYLALAASILLLAAVGFYFFSGPDTPAQLYGSYYASYDASQEMRSGNAVPKNLLDEAFDAYNAAQFETALAGFDKILATVPGNSRAQFYRGICKLELGEPAEARNAFKQVLAQGQNLYLSQATWYLGLSCLKLEDLPCARNNLSSLAAGPGKYQTSSQELIEELPKD